MSLTERPCNLPAGGDGAAGAGHTPYSSHMHLAHARQHHPRVHEGQARSRTVARSALRSMGVCRARQRSGVRFASCRGSYQYWHGYFGVLASPGRLAPAVSCFLRMSFDVLKQTSSAYGPARHQTIATNQCDQCESCARTYWYSACSGSSGAHMYPYLLHVDMWRSPLQISGK